METFLPYVLPAIFLLLLTGGFLVVYIEPYFAVTTKEGIKLLRYYAGDPKLAAIAEFWTAHLFCLVDGRFDPANANALAYRNNLHYLLMHNRFVTGDEPQIMRYSGRKTHRILRRAFSNTGLQPAICAKDIAIKIKPDRVETFTGQVIWAGSPQAYRSRFNDMYAEP